jgi:hypothetical protein
MKLQSTNNKPVELSILSLEDQKRVSYQAEADPLFFKWQRGEATKEEWLAKVLEIKERFKNV